MMYWNEILGKEKPEKFAKYKKEIKKKQECMQNMRKKFYKENPDLKNIKELPWDCSVL